MRLPAISPSPATIAPLPWGCIGEHALAHKGSQTIIRRTIVDTGVTYTLPPRDVVLTWQAVPGSETEFEMVWPDDKAEAVVPLRDLGEDLRSRPPVNLADPRLAQVEAAVDTLFTMVGRLHEAGWSIGLLQPGNVLVSSESPPRIVLPDLGFVWKENDLLVPDWLRSAFAPLWDEAPQRQQALQPSGQPIDARAETATLARVLNCVLTGRIQKEITPPAPDAARPVRRSASWCRLWNVLAQASRRECATVEELRRQLDEIKLRSHYSRARASAWVPVGLGALLLLALGAGAAWWTGWLNLDKMPPGTTSAPNAKKKTDPRLVSFQETLERLKQEFASASPARRSRIVVEIHEAAPSPEVALPETDRLRETVLDQWQDRCRLATNALNREQSLEHYQALVALHQELEDHLRQMKPVPASERVASREQECLAFIQSMLE